MAARQKRPDLAYVYIAEGGATSHAAHVPRLLRSLEKHCRVVAVAYGGEVPAGLSGASLPRRPRWLSAWTLVVALVHLRPRVILVRILWPVALALLPGQWLGLWKVLLWQSGGVVHDRCIVSGGTTRSLRDRMHRLTMRRCAAVVTGPPTVVRATRSVFGVRRVVTLANDVDVMAWSSQADVPPNLPAAWLDAPIRLVSVQSQSWMRGSDLLPAVVADPVLAGAHLLVIGSGSPIADERVSGPMVLPNEQLAAVLQRAHCMVVPSRAEGFPRVVVEAMAAGCPCVAFDVGGVRDLLQEVDDGLVVPRYDTGALASAAARAASARDVLRPKLLSRAKSFDVEVVSPRLAALARAVAANDSESMSSISRDWDTRCG